MFDVGKFKSTVSRYGVAKPNLYALNITPPPGLPSDPFITELPLLVTSANLPGVSLVADGYRHLGYGMNEQRVNGATLDQLTLTILGDGEGHVLNFFHNWMQLTHNTDAGAPSSSYGMPYGTSNYPNEYWGTVDLYLYNPAADVYEHYTFTDAHPMTVAGVQVGWEMNDQYMQIPISMSYRSFSSGAIRNNRQTATPTPSIIIGNSRDTAVLEKLVLELDKDFVARRYNI